MSENQKNIWSELRPNPTQLYANMLIFKTRKFTHPYAMLMRISNKNFSCTQYESKGFISSILNKAYQSHLDKRERKLKKSLINKRKKEKDYTQFPTCNKSYL